jgi:hypothetical protein
MSTPSIDPDLLPPYASSSSAWLLHETIDPDLLPPYAGSPGAWLLHETIDHLWPWSRRGFRHHKWALVIGVALALVVSMIWVLAGLGKVTASAVIGWWACWSVFEIMIRMYSKPYIKEGPWWGRNYRPANVMDMLCYVSFKNLLIGAMLFLGLKALGLLQM